MPDAKAVAVKQKQQDNVSHTYCDQCYPSAALAITLCGWTDPTAQDNDHASPPGCVVCLDLEGFGCPRCGLGQ